MLEEKMFNKPECSRDKGTYVHFVLVITILMLTEKWSMSWIGISVLTEFFCW